MNNILNENLIALILQQSILDSQADYERMLKRSDFPRFDVIAITASNEHQAETFRAQLASRNLPSGTEFVVIPDKDGKRVGSGGATLSTIKYIKEKYGSFKGLRAICLHSGGDSKRTPNYSALGKLFSPVPRTLPNGNPSTLFDEFLISTASIPGRISEGMLLLSGDVLLLFNPLQIDFSGHGAAAISFKEPVETCRNHGVFLKGESGNVKRFLHKQSVETLKDCGAVDERGNCCIDTGAVIFAPDMLEDLYSLVKDGKGTDKYINPKTRLSLYGDFLYPLAENSTLEEFYKESPEGEFCDELKDARTDIWNVLSKYSLNLLNIAPAKFLHFGTTSEIMELMNKKWEQYSYIGWNKTTNSSTDDGISAYNSIVSVGAQYGVGCYLENSYLHSNVKLGNNSIISCLEIDNAVIPDNIVLHGLKQENGKFVCRIYGINDNPKEDKLFGFNLNETALGTSGPLWNAEIYPECDTVQQAVEAALNIYNLINGKGDYISWSNSFKKSLCSGFNEADSNAIIEWSTRMSSLIRMERVINLINNHKPAAEAVDILQAGSLNKIQAEWLENRIAGLDLENINDLYVATRLYWYIGTGLNNEEYKTNAFKLISKTVLKSTLNEIEFNDSVRIVNDEVKINLPLRVNWGGGWTDTPPYCLENGGKVLNAAISLNGNLPVEVYIKRIPDLKIIFDSRDMGIHGEFDSIKELQDIGNPFDPFALQKACLIACGIIPKSGNNLKTILKRLGGGFEMHSKVTDVPMGSGLGTSSILAAACVKAVFEFTGMFYDDSVLYNHVLAMEQIMSTGGGWQDQVGGLINGIKLISSQKGINQELALKRITISQNTKDELNKRFCLIYTGQRRLARNLLREVVGRYLANTPESINAHRQIQTVAEKMALSLSSGDIECFAALLDEHWELSKQIDIETTNTLIEQILLTVDDLISGRFICGAGGGGFLQVIMKRGVTKEEVHQRLKSVFQDFPVDVWDCRFVF